MRSVRACTLGGEFKGKDKDVSVLGGHKEGKMALAEGFFGLDAFGRRLRRYIQV